MASDSEDEQHDETSPLLSEPTSGGVTAKYVESGISIVKPVADSPSLGHQSSTTAELPQQNGDPEAPRPDEAREAQFKGMPDVRKQLKYIFPSLSIGVFLVAADQTLVVATYGAIGSDLQSLNNSSWIATAYFLTLTSIQPLYGKLSDIFGRKTCLLFALFVFGLGCLFCGLAQNMEQLIMARAFTGIGGGGMTTVGSILMSDIVPLRERGTWQGVINIVFATGSSAGAPLGGVLADTIGWRWAFMGQVPLCVIAFLVVLFTMHLPQPDQEHWKARLKKIDFSGALVLVIAVTSLLVGLDQGSNVSWRSPIAIAFLVSVVPATFIFLIIELKYASNPFAPARVIFERSMLAAYLCNFFAFAGWFGIIFYLPLYYQAVDDVNAADAGLRLLPAIILSVTGSLLGGYIIQKTGRYYWLTVGGYTLIALGSIPVLLFSGLVSHSVVGLSVGIAIGGLGAGSAVTTSLIALISNAAPADQAIATACSYLFRSLGSVLGISIVSAVIQQQLRVRLREVLGSGVEAEEIVRRVRESLSYLRNLDPETAILVRDAYADSIRIAFGVIIGITACSVVSSVFLKEKRLSK